MRFKVIVFDFDGVIAESVHIKSEAFYALFDEHPEHAAAFKQYHLAHHAHSRFVQFRHMTENILKQPYTPDVEIALNQRFSTMVKNRIIACPLVPGAKELLTYVKAHWPIYVVSLTPDQELNDILNERALMPYFKKAYGSSQPKVDSLKNIMAETGAAPQEIFFVGDALSDYKAAQDSGVFFVARVINNVFDTMDMPKFKDMHGVLEFLKTNS